MEKPVFPKELMNDHMNESNKKWLTEYKSETDLDKGYYQKLENFFKFCDYENMPFNVFTVSDIEKYVGVMVDNNYKEDTINALPGALSGFKNFLIKKHPTIFSKNFLSDLPTRYFESGDPSDAFALSTTQINLIREFNKQNWIYEYIFEVYFQLGIKKKEIIVCHPNNSDKKRAFFKSPEGQEIKYNSKIAQLLELQKDQDINLTQVIANYYLSKVTEFLRQQEPLVYEKERTLNYLDIKKSHKKYVFSCPSCGQLTENNAKSWVLAKIEQGSDFRLACAECKGVFYGD